MPQRPDSLILITVYELIMAAMLLIVSCVVLPIALLLTPFGSGGSGEFLARFFVVGLVLAATFGIGIASGIVGFGLLLRKEWARVGAIALAIPALLGFPIWTVVGILIIVYLLSQEGRAAFRFDRHAAMLSVRTYRSEIITAETDPDPLVVDIPTAGPDTDFTAQRGDTNAPDQSGAKSPRLERISEEHDGKASGDPSQSPPN